LVLGLGKSKEEKQFDREMTVQEPYQESSDASMAADMQMEKPNYPSTMIPEDFYQYKRFINLPESQAKHPGRIDKDVVFANLSGPKPNIAELEYQVGTIKLFESEFGIWKDVYLRDADGNMVFEDVEQEDGSIKSVPFARKMFVFDETFRDSLDYLEATFKFGVVASRALGGSERAANLDVSTNTRISKEFSRKKEQTNKTWGAGL